LRNMQRQRHNKMDVPSLPPLVCKPLNDEQASLETQIPLGIGGAGAHLYGLGIIEYIVGVG
ncbi:hypothetical protein ACJX0J_024547, partial [Zea mays]